MTTDDRLSEIQSKLDVSCALQKRTHETVERVEKALWGNGSPGLFVRMDRVEQAQAGSKWLRRTLIAAIIGVFLAGVYSLIF